MEDENMFNEILFFLDDVTVKESQILGNIQYMEAYYPIDDHLRNRGNLSLVSPKYVLEFARILQIITNQYNLHMEEELEIPDNLFLQTFVSKCIKMYLSEFFNNIYNIYIQHSKSDKKINEQVLNDLLCKIVTRIIHAKVGGTVRKYRELNLKRVNDVSFRKTLSVKSKVKLDPKREKYQKVN